MRESWAGIITQRIYYVHTSMLDFFYGGPRWSRRGGSVALFVYGSRHFDTCVAKLRVVFLVFRARLRPEHFHVSAFCSPLFSQHFLSSNFLQTIATFTLRIFSSNVYSRFSSNLFKLFHSALFLSNVCSNFSPNSSNFLFA